MLLVESKWLRNKGYCYCLMNRVCISLYIYICWLVTCSDQHANHVMKKSINKLTTTCTMYIECQLTVAGQMRQSVLNIALLAGVLRIVKWSEVVLFCVGVYIYIYIHVYVYIYIYICTYWMMYLIGPISSQRTLCIHNVLCSSHWIPHQDEPTMSTTRSCESSVPVLLPSIGSLTHTQQCSVLFCSILLCYVSFASDPFTFLPCSSLLFVGSPFNWPYSLLLSDRPCSIYLSLSLSPIAAVKFSHLSCHLMYQCSFFRSITNCIYRKRCSINKVNSDGRNNNTAKATITTGQY